MPSNIDQTQSELELVERRLATADDTRSVRS